MEAQQLNRSKWLPARRGEDAFVRGIAASVILGLVIWAVIIILGVLIIG